MQARQKINNRWQVPVEQDKLTGNNIRAVETQLMSESEIAKLQNAIDEIRNGDESRREELLNFATDRLRSLTRKALREYQRVRRWEETDDVFQNAMIRLWKALKKTEVESVKHFMRLAARQIRWELKDLARHYYGPEGHGAHHRTEGAHDTSGGEGPPNYEQVETTREPRRLAQWSEFHEKVETLPEEEKEVFDLVYYQGISQPEAARILNLSERTLQRRWQSARLRLHEMMNGELPI